MNPELKFELKLKQLEMAINRLEIYKAKGWKSMIESVTAQIVKLEKEIDELEA
jgi:hypothetical protein